MRSFLAVLVLLGLGLVEALLELPLGVAVEGAIDRFPQMRRLATVATATTITFGVTTPGAAQNYTVPTGVTQLIIKACGAKGGSGKSYTATYNGGSGGCITAQVVVTSGAKLSVYVGGKGSRGITSADQGYNGGGFGGQGSYIYAQGAGGGASDVRTSTALSTRLISGGGGGGGAWYSKGGDGGGPKGANSPYASGGATGGSITAGGAGFATSQNGALGLGGSGGAGGGGGGGGWYGGAGAVNGGGGAGGSSYVISGSTVTANVQGSNSASDGSVSITFVGVEILDAEVADAGYLCNIYDTFVSTNTFVSAREQLTNWCTTGANTYIPGPCNTASPWKGVTCTSGRVTSLSLSSFALGGSLPTSIAGLNALTSLVITSCALGGTLPTQLSSMTKLRTLSLTSNSLTSTLPNELSALSSLKIMDLSSNSLRGTLPSSFASLFSVQQLLLSNNILTGTIPEAFAYLYSLTSLDLSSNTGINGALSQSFCYFPSGATLNVQGTGLTCYPLNSNGNCVRLTTATFFKDSSLLSCDSATTATPNPTRDPTVFPTEIPTIAPSTVTPTTAPPTPRPSTFIPTAVPTKVPTHAPSGQPSGRPSGQPTRQPTNPTSQPTYVLQTLVRCNVTMALEIASGTLSLSTFYPPSSSPTSSPSAVSAATAFAKAMAKAINLASGNRTRLVYSAITIANVTGITNRRVLLGGRRLATAALVTVTIATSTQQLGDPDAEAGFATLSDAVSGALSTTTFQTQLAAESAASNVLAGVSAPATPPDISEASYTVMRSGSPTGQPTSSPSRIVCTTGFRHDLYSPICTACDAGTSSVLDATTCFDCKAGQMAPIAGSPACLDCAVGSYSSSKRSLTCSRCEFPSYTAFPGSTVCSAACICASATYVIIFYVLAVVFYVSSLAVVGVKSPSLMLFSILPALDIISDLQYIIVTTFYSYALFIPCVIFVVAPSSLFVRRLWKMKALRPHFLVPIPQFLSDDTLLWLSQRHGRPLFRGEKMALSFDRHDTLYKLVAFWLLWVAVCVGQAASLLVYILLLSPLVVLHTPFWTFWLFFGFYLYQIKMMSVGKVWTIWFHVWRSKDLKKNGTGRLDSHVLVDTELMNESLFAAFFFETVPHLVLQATNNQLLNRWTPVAYFSTTLSVFNCINGLYRSLYYIYFLGVDFADIPLEIRIGTVTLSLDKATHLEGLEFKHDYHLLTRAEVEMIFVEKDNRLAEVNQLLRDPTAIRSHSYYGNGRFHLLPEPSAEEEARPSFFSRFSFKMHLGREKYDDSDPQYQWLVQLGQVVMEWENPSTPVLSDLFTLNIMKAFKAHSIVHERELHALLVRLRDADARRAFVRDELALGGRLYADMLCEYFARSWERLEAEGRGLDYVYELGSKEEEEERLETFHHDASQDLWRSVDESGHQEYDAVPDNSPSKPPRAVDDRIPLPTTPLSPRQLPPTPFTPSGSTAVSSFFSLRPAAPAVGDRAEDAELDAVVLHAGEALADAEEVPTDLRQV